MCSSRTCFRKWMKRPRISKRLVKAYVALFISMFSSSFAITMMFPFAPFLVRFLLPQVEETDVGNYVGMLAAAMFFGRFLASYIWGLIADHKGRKPVIIASSILLGLSSAVFGFSTHFAMAILARFVVGATNGVVGTSKAVISEISDDSTQALGVSIISTSWGLGFVIGPAVSGAISDPIGQYHLNITNTAIRSFLTKFPYSLPCLLNTLLCLIAALVTFFLLPETKGMKKNRRRSEIDRLDVKSVVGGTASDGGVGGTNNDEDMADGVDCSDPADEQGQRSLIEHCEDISKSVENGHVSEGGDGKEGEDTSSKRTVLHTYSVFVSRERREGDSSHHEGCGGISESKSENPSPGEQVGAMREERERGSVKINVEQDGKTKLSWRQRVRVGVKASVKDLKLFLCSRGSSVSLFIYCIFSFGVIGMDEVYSLWVFTSAHHGGLGFTLYQIGISLSVAGAVMLPTSLVLYPLLERYLGLINTYYLSVCVVIAVSVLLPNLHYLVPFGLSWLLWISLCIMKFLFMVFVSAAFASTILFINNSVTFDKLGAINGLAVSMTAITRTISPIFAGSVFAGSLSSATLQIGFPFNYNLIFVIFGSVFLSTVVMATCLPPSINKQKVIEDVEMEESEGERSEDISVEDSSIQESRT